MATVAGAALAVVAVAHADVTLEQRVEMGGPLASIAKFSVDTKSAIAGDKARIDDKVTCGNALMRMFCPGDTAQIIRLDRDLVYQLDLKKKTYYEESFADLRRRQEEAVRSMRDAQSRQPDQKSAPDESQCEMLPAKADLKRSGEKATFAGFEAERATITVVQPCKDRKTGSVCDIRWVADQWLTSADVGAGEQQKFWRAYAAKLSLDETATRTSVAQAMAYMQKYPGSFAELAKKMQGLKGQPVKMTMQLSTGGPDCKQAQDAASAPSSDGESGGGGRPSVGGAVAGALGGLFGRKKKDEGAATAPTTPAASQAPAAPAGYVTLMELTSETKSLTSGAVAADQFDVPAGFRKVDPPDHRR